MLVSGMCSLIKIAVPRPLVPMLTCAIYPRIMPNTGCMTSCKRMMSISCFRMKSPSIAILVCDDRPFMLRVAILWVVAIVLRHVGAFYGVYTALGNVVLVLILFRSWGFSTCLFTSSFFWPLGAGRLRYR